MATRMDSVGGYEDWTISSASVYPASKSTCMLEDVERFWIAEDGVSNTRVRGKIGHEVAGVSKEAIVMVCAGEASDTKVATGKRTSGQHGCATEADTGSATDGARSEVMPRPVTGDREGTTLAGGAVVPNSAMVL